MDFLVLPLTPATVPAIEKAIFSKVAFKGYAGIVHVQINAETLRTGDFTHNSVYECNGDFSSVESPVR
jgi:hypothetical protein